MTFLTAVQIWVGFVINGLTWVVLAGAWLVVRKRWTPGQLSALSWFAGMFFGIAGLLLVLALSIYFDGNTATGHYGSAALVLAGLR